MIKFGVAGNSASFYNDGNKTTIQAATWCKKRGIDIFEYSFGQGITVSDDTCRQIGKEFLKNDVEVSVHAPYFTNFSNPSDEMIEKTINYVINSAQKVKLFCGSRVVVHPASQGKMNRETAQKIAIDNMKILSEKLDEYDLNDVIICFETLGKNGQMGSLTEVIEYCNLDNRFYPCIDFGHINAREQGVLKSSEDFKKVIMQLKDGLPFNKVENMHAHFSKIKFGAKGELCHLTFEDEIYGPKFENLSQILHEENLSPYIICESNGTQAEDAMFMKNYFWGNI